jgi:flagellar hook-basal body complex protein FliE
MATNAIAATAYARLARISDPAARLTTTVGESANAAQGPSFGSLLNDVVGTLSEAGQKSDAQAQALAVGKANIVDVVTAVAETETAIATLVSVRDKVIQAYEEIMRMQI